MGNVVLDISVSVDGFITGPNDVIGRPLGDGGERLHHWISDRRTDDDEKVLRELFEDTGAVVAGRRTYDLSEGPDGWGDGPLGTTPVFVVTHDAPVRTATGGAVFTFVTDGVASAVRKAMAVAGDRNVYVMGGGDLARQCVAAGLVDEIQLHLVPVLLGGGVPLFGPGGPGNVVLESNRVIATPSATHVRYRVLNSV
ncbi:MAG TPA: dihydrofolate reductase family protein [Actinophytocola sp.]|uniref:dihydrofolate reductase family protein n=1 Tax=Actinophytocola sp. TaxID=1872138 RepID=UPI002DDD13A2|nr:dihydrofolate reductase family protein [Actinophytocola sp.]HEV2781554.1 dihydrofolate reductase family protein [Actinophytocola sp.]